MLLFKEEGLAHPILGGHLLPLMEGRLDQEILGEIYALKGQGCLEMWHLDLGVQGLGVRFLPKIDHYYTLTLSLEEGNQKGRYLDHQGQGGLPYRNRTDRIFHLKTVFPLKAYMVGHCLMNRLEGSLLFTPEVLHLEKILDLTLIGAILPHETSLTTGRCQVKGTGLGTSQKTWRKGEFGEMYRITEDRFGTKGKKEPTSRETAGHVIKLICIMILKSQVDLTDIEGHSLTFKIKEVVMPGTLQMRSEFQLSLFST